MRELSEKNSLLQLQLEHRDVRENLHRDQVVELREAMRKIAELENEVDRLQSQITVSPPVCRTVRSPSACRGSDVAPWYSTWRQA